MTSSALIYSPKVKIPLKKLEMQKKVKCFGVKFLLVLSLDLRLANGGSNMSGRVEVMYSGRWGTVCNHNWDVNAANVVCRQLGYRRAEAVGFFGKGFGQIFLDKVRCEGSEPSLAFCYHSGWYAAKNCTHDNDAGVVCTNSKYKICDMMVTPPPTTAATPNEN